MKDPIGLNFDIKLCEKYFRDYKNVDQRKMMLQYCEMITFHMLVLLLNSKQPIDLKDRQMYYDEFRKLIESDFSG